MVNNNGSPIDVGNYQMELCEPSCLVIGSRDANISDIPRFDLDCHPCQVASPHPTSISGIGFGKADSSLHGLGRGRWVLNGDCFLSVPVCRGRGIGDPSPGP